MWRETKPSGIPVLFVPGNAGSFRQVRSLAASAARQFFHNPGVPDEALLRMGGRSLDFFSGQLLPNETKSELMFIPAVDFNEDFSAFHGTTLLEQAEYLNDAVRYILSLYTQLPSSRSRPHPLPDPEAVILVGHSMGGISARKMLLMPNYQLNSVNTILTLSTPHVVPPATFDSRIEDIYDEINTFWRSSYVTNHSPLPVESQYQQPLDEVVLISLSGGTSDTTITSDAGLSCVYCTTKSWFHGFHNVDPDTV